MAGRNLNSLVGSVRLRAGLLWLALVALPTPLAAADAVPIETFYGHFQGSGVAENADSLYFGVSVRDMDVRIGPKGAGFFVEWTSVIRAGGDPNDPDVKRRTETVGFVPVTHPQVFDAPGAQDPRGATGLVWARLVERTLTVNVMRITNVGGYVVQTYNRTLDGNGMSLHFVSVSDGESRREVEARLVKVGN